MKRIVAAVLVVMFMASPLFAAGGSLGSFEAYDFSDNRVTSAVFGDYDVTMINFFTTSCVYCMCEIQSLSAVKNALPARANVIAVCADAYDLTEALDDVVGNFPADFTVLKMTDRQLAAVPYLLGYPTTLFVDSEGNILKVIAGVPNHPTDTYIETVRSLLAKR